MQVFKTFIKIALRNLGLAIMYISIFTSLSFGLARSSEKNEQLSFTDSKIKIAVIDKDNSETSKALYNFLDEIHTIVDIGEDEESISDELYYKNVLQVITIEEGFEKKVMDGNSEGAISSYESPGSNSSYIVENQVNSYVSTVMTYLSAGFSKTEAFEKTKAAVTSEVTVTFPDDEKPEKPSPISYFFTFVPYMLFCAILNVIAPMVMIWNRTEIRKRTAISSMKFSTRNAGVIGAMTVCSIGILILFGLVAAIVFKGAFFTESAIYYMLNTAVYLLVCLSFVLLIGNLTSKPQMISVFSNVIGLSTSFLCGVFVDRSLLGDGVVNFSRCLPTYWYINVTEELKYFDGTLSSYAWKSMGIELLFAAAITAIALFVIKIKQQKAN